jgi:4a-hydroxytetrahydrobiopterin dehydratase
MQIPECGWHLVQEGGLRIQTHLKFKNFKKALEFVNELGELAEQEGHHPDISIHDWNQVEVSFHTHAINGLHENDFIMAAKVNELIHQQS